MKTVALSQVRIELSKYLRKAQKEEVVVITRHGRPAGVLKGFASEDDWIAYRLLNDPEFQRRVTKAREEVRDGKGTSIETIREQTERELAGDE
jgi:prevent-host-death family protein